MEQDATDPAPKEIGDFQPEEGNSVAQTQNQTCCNPKDNSNKQDMYFIQRSDTTIDYQETPEEMIMRLRAGIQFANRSAIPYTANVPENHVLKNIFFNLLKGLPSSTSVTVDFGTKDTNMKQYNPGFLFFTEQCPINSVAFNFAGDQILISSIQSVAKMVSLKTRDVVKRFQNENTNNISINAIVFSPDEHFVAMGDSHGYISIVSMDNNTCFKFLAHSRPINTVVFHPDSTFILSGSQDGLVKLWTTNGIIAGVYEGHQGSILSVAFNHDGSKIISGSSDKTIRIWNTYQQIELTKIDNKSIVTSAVFSPDDRLIVVCSKDNTVKLLNNEDVPTPFHIFKNHSDIVSCAAFSKCGKYFITGSFDSSVRLWRMSDMKLIRTFMYYRDMINPSQLMACSFIATVAFSHDNRYIIAGDYWGHVILWQSDLVPDFEWMI